MMHVLHLLDASGGWQQRVGICHLLDRLGEDHFRQTVCGLHRRALEAWRPAGRPILVTPTRSGPMPLAAMCGNGALRSAMRRHRPDVVHAWGLDAAQRARAVWNAPLAVTCAEPRLHHAEANAYRALADPRWSAPVAFHCLSRQIHRRLVEHGVPLESCVIIRPAVDFTVANRARRGPLRARLGARPGDVLVTCPDVVRHGDGIEDGIWAASVVAEVDEAIRVAIPGTSAARHRLGPLARRTVRPSTVMVSDPTTPYEELVAAADVLVITAREDVPVTSAAWAMASGTVVVGAAGYALTELIAHRQNGLLFKREPDQPILSKIAPLLLDRSDYARLAEVARGQAYEVFGLRRYADQVARAYDNLLKGVAAGEGITDSAMAG
ncbi:MAG: glycosyltransferase [Phycisphaerales bacterium]|nr:MAG: glycosyltransferase [Phycisphaerales bacterium]